MARRHGDPAGFWNNAAVGVGGLSTKVDIGRSDEDLVLYATSSADTVLELLVAHTGALTSEGILPDGTPADNLFYPVWYTSGGPSANGQVVKVEMNLVSTAPYSRSMALIVPDFTPGWLRLRSSAAATITAGWEAQGLD